MTLSNDNTWSLSATIAKADASDVSIYVVPHGASTKVELFTIELNDDDPLPLDRSFSSNISFPLQISDSISVANAIDTDRLPASISVPQSTPGPTIRLPVQQDRVVELVHRAWALVLSPAVDTSDSDAPPEDTPFYSIWGNIIAAAQFVAIYAPHVDVQLNVEDILENPTVEKMVELLRGRLRTEEKYDGS